MSTGISQLTVLFCPWVILGLGGGNTVEGRGKMVGDASFGY